MAATIPRFLLEQFFYKCPPPTTLLPGRVIIVTGGNTGLGLETVIHLAKLKPAKIIIACRDISKGEKAREEVASRTGFKNVEVWALDLSSYDSIFAFVHRCEGLERLDSFIENAGLEMVKYQKSQEGWEMTLQVNVISTGLLGLMVLPILQRTAELPNPDPKTPFKPHLTITGSAVHIWANFPEKDEPGSIVEKMSNDSTFFDNKSLTAQLERYNVSKLLVLFITRKMATLSVASAVTVNVVQPGLCKSNLGGSHRGGMGAVLNLLSRSTAKGAANIAWGAVSPTASGANVSCSSVKLPSAWSMSPEGLKIQDKIWNELCQEWVRVVPELRGTLGM